MPFCNSSTALYPAGRPRRTVSSGSIPVALCVGDRRSAGSWRRTARDQSLCSAGADASWGGNRKYFALPPAAQSRRHRGPARFWGDCRNTCGKMICCIAVYCLTVGRSLMFSRELKKGSTELLVLALLEARPRHGYELGKLIESRSHGRLQFRIGSLYPILCRLEEKGLIIGRWVEKSGERRRRFYRLTSAGRSMLATQRNVWQDFISAVNQILGGEHA